MSKPKDNVTSLLAAIQRKNPSAPASKSKPEPAKVIKAQTLSTKKRAVKPEPEEAKPKGRGGRPIQFWFHDDDRRLIRELAAWLAGQGLRPTDSLVVRAALRMAKTGGALLEAYHEEARLDGRLKRVNATETK
jgi:hypothetical protein